MQYYPNPDEGLDIHAVNKVIEEAFAEHGRGKVQMPPKVYIAFDHGDFRTMPADFRNLGDLIREGLRRRDLEAGVLQARAVSMWERVVGETVAAATRAESIRDGVLWVVTKSSAWSHELSMMREELVKRTRPAIEKQLADYYIFEIDKNPVACVALHTWPELGKGELACLYVSSAHENQGIGRKLVQFVENKARELGLQELIALSTQAFTWFQSKGGFAEGTPDDLPPARREKYDQSGRHSKILLKKLK